MCTYLSILITATDALLQSGGNLRDSLYHVQPHLHTAVGVVGPRLRQTRHAVVAVSQNLDPQTVVLLSREAWAQERATYWRGILENKDVIAMGFRVTSLLCNSPMVGDLWEPVKQRHTAITGSTLWYPLFIFHLTIVSCNSVDKIPQ